MGAAKGVFNRMEYLIWNAEAGGHTNAGNVTEMFMANYNLFNNFASNYEPGLKWRGLCRLLGALT